MRTAPIVALALGLILLATPVSAAATSELTVSSAVVPGATSEGEPRLLMVVDGQSERAEDLMVTLTAGEVVGRAKSETSTQWVTPSPSTPLMEMDNVPQPQLELLNDGVDTHPVGLSDALLALSSFDDDFGLLVHPLPGATMRAVTPAFEARPSNFAMPCGQYINDDMRAQGCTRGDDGDNYVGFHNEPVQDSLVISNADMDVFTVALEGDFRIQLMGIDLRSDKGETLRSTVDREQVATDGSPVEEITLRMLDLHVRDGSLIVASTGLGGRVNWAASTLDVAAEGTVVAKQAIGYYHGETVDMPRFAFGAPDRLLLAPSDENGRMTMQSYDNAELGFMASAFGVAPDEWVGTTFTLVGALSVTAAIAFGAYTLVANRFKTMKDVEAAIAAKKYRSAARMAGRLLRRDPDNEDLAVARAVALSRAGANARVVREVSARIERRPPTDGVLHYVLGLAHLALDERDDAFIHLKEAAIMTPSLELDVARRIGRPPRPASSGGYA